MKKLFHYNSSNIERLPDMTFSVAGDGFLVVSARFFFLSINNIHF